MTNTESGANQLLGQQPFGITKFGGNDTRHDVLARSLLPELYYNIRYPSTYILIKSEYKKDTGTSILAPLDEDPGLHGSNICNL